MTFSLGFLALLPLIEGGMLLFVYSSFLVRLFFGPPFFPFTSPSSLLFGVYISLILSFTLYSLATIIPQKKVVSVLHLSGMAKELQHEVVAHTFCETQNSEKRSDMGFKGTNDTYQQEASNLKLTHETMEESRFHRIILSKIRKGLLNIFRDFDLIIALMDLSINMSKRSRDVFKIKKNIDRNTFFGCA